MHIYYAKIQNFCRSVLLQRDLDAGTIPMIDFKRTLGECKASLAQVNKVLALEPSHAYTYAVGKKAKALAAEIEDLIRLADFL